MTRFSAPSNNGLGLHIYEDKLGLATAYSALSQPDMDGDDIFEMDSPTSDAGLQSWEQVDVRRLTDMQTSAFQSQDTAMASASGWAVSPAAQLPSSAEPRTLSLEQPDSSSCHSTERAMGASPQQPDRQEQPAAAALATTMRHWVCRQGRVMPLPLPAGIAPVRGVQPTQPAPAACCGGPKERLRQQVESAVQRELAASKATGVPLEPTCLAQALCQHGLFATAVQPICSGKGAVAATGGNSPATGGAQPPPAAAAAPAAAVAPPSSGSAPSFWSSSRPYVIVRQPASPDQAHHLHPLLRPLLLLQQRRSAAAAGASPLDEEEVVVELGLRDMFCAAPCTPEYAAHVRALPEVFVGSRQSLLALATRACQELARSFGALGLSIPPWRKHAAMVARWQVRTAPLQAPDGAACGSGGAAGGDGLVAVAAGAAIMHGFEVAAAIAKGRIALAVPGAAKAVCHAIDVRALRAGAADAVCEVRVAADAVGVTSRCGSGSGCEPARVVRGFEVPAAAGQESA